MVASGQIGKTMVYGSWRGIPYVRRYVKPSNPNSTNQVKTRSIFAFVSQVWKHAPALLRAPWDAYATGQQFLGRNAFMGQNTKALRPGTDMSAFIGSPGAKGGSAPTAVSATGSAGSIAVTLTNPAAPSGWTLTNAVAAAIQNLDPHSSTDYTATVAEDAGDPTSVSIGGLAAGDYEVSAWLVWTKPDGTLAYGPSLNATATVT